MSTNIFQRIAARYIVPAKTPVPHNGGVFDIESNGLLDTATKIHCIVIVELDSDRVHEYGPKQIKAGLKHLSRLDYLVGHNVAIFDLPLLQQLHGWAPKADCRVVDTLIASRLILPHVGDLDDQAAALGDSKLGKLRGRYSIEAWGFRLGMPKVGVGLENFSTFTSEMMERCVGDTAISKQLWQFLQPDGYSQYALELEMRVAPLCDKIAATGMYFDSAVAAKLQQQWTTRRAELEAQLAKQFPDTNLNSRQQIGAMLEARGWVPEHRTEKTKQPKIDDELLESIAALYPEFAGLSEHYILGRRLGQLVNGKKAWAKNAGADGRIHGGLVHIGTPHSRAKHLEPNLAQVPNPKRGKPFATECRSLFKARDGWTLVACDQATLQDRGFAHYLTEFDGGAYAKDFLAGVDTHWRTATALGLVTHERDKHSKVDTAIREGSKSFRYAFLYGVGVHTAGAIVARIVRATHQLNPASDLPQRFFGGQTHPKESALKRVGRQSLDKFEAATPGLRQLRNKLQAFAQRHGWLPGLDGRRVPVRALYSALNFIVTSSEAIICKRWLVRTYDELCASFRYGWDGDVVLCLWVHDEIVACCRPEIAEEVGAIMVRNAKEPGDFYHFKVPLDADFKISANWGGGDSVGDSASATAADAPSIAPDPVDEVEEHDDHGAEAVVIEAPIPGLEEAIADVRAFIAAAASGRLPATPVEQPCGNGGAGNGHAGNGFDYRFDRESKYPAGEHQRGAQATSYVYKDERGTPYMRVIRTIGKSFPTQHRSNGRWIMGWPASAIPYRLPELLAAPPTEPVWICEGEKDADNVAALGLITTTNPGGASKWQPELAQWFKGKQLAYVLEDNDDAGRMHTSKIQSALTGIVPAVAVVSFPELAEKADVSDWLEQGGNKELLLARAEQALRRNTLQEPIEPVDLWGQFDPPPLPPGLLPDVIEQFAHEEGNLTGADPSGFAAAALAVCAAALPDHTQLQVKRHDPNWLEAARLWVGLIGNPSTKKTPIMQRAVKPLKRLDAELWREFLAARESYDELCPAERKGVERPKQKRLRLEDSTIEGAQELLKDSPDGVLCIQDELAGWFGAMDKYSGRGAAKDRGFWLQAFHGGPYAVNRVARGAFLIPNLSVSLLGGVQPDPVRKIADDTVDDGLLQRLIPVVLARGQAGKDAPAGSAGRRYDELIGQLHERTHPGAPLQFDDAALEIRQGLERKHLELMNYEAVNRKLAAHIGKYDGIFARLCLLWHCIEQPSEDLIVTGHTARRVADFLQRFLLPHATAFYAGTLELSDDHDRLTQVAGYILARKLTRVTNRDVQHGNNAMRGLERHEIENVFDQLEALGWLTRTPGPLWSKPPHWLVNPEVHRRFAERAAREATERAKQRAMLQEMFSGAKQ